MLSFLPAFVLRAATRRLFRLARGAHKAAALADKREALEGGYRPHPAIGAVLFVVCLFLTALAEGS